MRNGLLALACCLLVLPLFFVFSKEASAQTLLQDQVSYMKAKVISIDSSHMEEVPGTDTEENYQTIHALVLGGTDNGQTVVLDNDYLKLSVGEEFYLTKTVRAEDGQILYAVSDPYRLPALIFFGVLFLVLVLIFGGLQGLRGLISLAGSFILILYVLLPGILHGYSPILLSIGISSLIIILGSYITHGFNKTTSSAVIGMIVTVIITGALAYWAVTWANLSGFNNEEATYLNFDTHGSINFVGLLFGGIMIGLLGVLYDIAIGQAISVEELHKVAPHLPRLTIYNRAIRIGREHIGALVNTLVIAYVGVSLPLLLLYSESATAGSIGLTINREIFATEIIRTLIGSIGLVLAVPITTLITTLILIRTTEAPAEVVKLEKEKIEHAGHHH